MSLKISIDEQSNLFKKHLEEQGNKRIIFSGGFGVGKTYFLNEFFNLPDSEYLTIKLTPVNYSISSNEDIFNIIKYDILCSLAFAHQLSLKGQKIKWDIALGVMLPAKGEAIIQSLVPLLPLLNKPTEAIPLVLAALAGWLSMSDEIAVQREAASEESEVIAFGEKMAAHYKFESDYITTFLENGLNKLLIETGRKQKILIIDDLDRIDPEHIFRIFNIFSAHLDYNNANSNKFGFDKIIFVCDIQNIRNIFHNRYGTDTDFTGYIDKFFSKEVYYFSNQKEMSNAIDDIINSFNFEKSRNEYFQLNILQGINWQDKGLLHVVLLELLSLGALKIRRLEESYGSSILLPTKSLTVIVPNYGEQQISYRYLPSLVTIEILSKIMGGGIALLRALNTLIKYRKSSEYLNLQSDRNQWLVGTLIPLVDYDIHNFKRDSFGAGTTYTFDYTSQQKVEYELLMSQSKGGYYFGKLKDGNLHLDLFVIMHRVVEGLIRDGLLK